jgi:hypothetical protein
MMNQTDVACEPEPLCAALTSRTELASLRRVVLAPWRDAAHNEPQVAVLKIYELQLREDRGPVPIRMHS